MSRPASTSGQVSGGVFLKALLTRVELSHLYVTSKDRTLDDTDFAMETVDRCSSTRRSPDPTACGPSLVGAVTGRG
jgi:hypothetical protein